MRSCGILNENYMKNKDIMEWMLDEGIDPLMTVTTEKGEMYLSDILTKHLTEQLRIHDVVGRSEQLKCRCKKSQFTRTVDADFNALCGRCGKAL
jgi:hypothetical protein